MLPFSCFAYIHSYCTVVWHRGYIGHGRAENFFLPGWAGFFPLRLDHNFVSSNWAKPSRVKFKGLLIFRAVISIISIVIYVLICPTYYVDTWVSHSTCKPLLKPLLNEAFILVLMMKSLLFWSMKILKVLCENWAYNLNIEWAYPI